MSSTILNPASRAFQAVMLRAHARLFQRGLRHSRFTKSQLLRRVGEITDLGPYSPHSRKELQRAINDLTVIIDGDAGQQAIRSSINSSPE